MKIYLILRDYDISSTEVLRAFRHEDHAKKVCRKLKKEEKYEEDDLRVVSMELLD